MKSKSYQFIENLFFQETQYSRWLAACRMAAKGKTMADSGYDSEVKAIQAFLSMQHPASQPVINPSTLDIRVEEYVAARFYRRGKSKVRFAFVIKMQTYQNKIFSFYSFDKKFLRPMLM